MFTNLQVYQLREAINLNELEEMVATKPAKPCSAELSLTIGFSAIADSESYTLKCKDFVLLKVTTSEKVIPKATLRKEQAKRIAEEEEESAVPFDKAMKEQIKREVYSELLARAIEKLKDTYMIINTKDNLIFINSSSKGLSERCLNVLRDALGSLRVVPLATQLQPDCVMTDWLRKQQAARGFFILNECDLISALEEGGTIKIKHEDLITEEVQAHIKNGKLVTKLGLAYDNLTFTIDKSLTFRRIHHLYDPNELEDNAEDQDLQLSTEVFIFGNAITQMITSLTTAFGGIKESPTTDLSTTSQAANDDPLYDDAVTIVKKTGNAGISHLQRQLRIGYNRAAILIEKMEEQGIVSPFNPITGKRTVS